MRLINTLTKKVVMGRFTLCLVGAAVVLGFCLLFGPALANAQDLCQSSTKEVLKSCRWEAMADYWLATANCDNLSDSEEKTACKEEAREALQETLGECSDQNEARLEICDELGPDPYDPEINPDDFLDVEDIVANPNPYYPLIPGAVRVLEAETEDGTERIEVTVTDETREILGVECVVVRDTVTLDGELIEDTFDWFAQDAEGNVWYFGELSMEFEDGELVGLEGSWEAGEDGAKPGIVMWANPVVGEVYRQEFFLAEAEDMGEVLALGQTVTVPYGRFENCVMTKDFTPIEPDVEENKFYAPGVGVVLEVDVETGERVELVDVMTAGELEEVLIYLEQNFTDQDTEVVAFVKGDDEGLKSLKVFDPEGEKILDFTAKEETLGLREFALESPEPDLEEVLEAYPAGEYTFKGQTVEGKVLEGSAILTHNIPQPTTITFPGEDASDIDSTADLTIAWTAVNGAVKYIVEVTREDPLPEITLQGEALPPATSFTVPADWIDADSEYQVAVAVVNADGNVTSVELTFSTAAQ